jgi:hypothetical protein
MVLACVTTTNTNRSQTYSKAKKLPTIKNMDMENDRKAREEEIGSYKNDVEPVYSTHLGQNATSARYDEPTYSASSLSKSNESPFHAPFRNHDNDDAVIDRQGAGSSDGTNSGNATNDHTNSYYNVINPEPYHPAEDHHKKSWHTSTYADSIHSDSINNVAPSRHVATDKENLLQQQPHYGHYQNYASSPNTAYPTPVSDQEPQDQYQNNAPTEKSSEHDAGQGAQTWNQQQKYHYQEHLSHHPPHYHHQVPYYNNPHPGGSYPSYYNYDNHGARNGGPAYWNYWQQHQQPPSGGEVNYHKRSFYEYESASSMHGDPTGGVHHQHTPVEGSPSYANRRPPAKKRSKKRPDDMPRYPLSAYNFFFSEEREVVLAVLSSSSAAAKKEARTIQNESSNTSTGGEEEAGSTAEQPDEETASQYHNQEEEMEHIKNILSTHKIPEEPLKELQKKIKANTQRMLDTHLEGGKAKKSHKKTHGKITFQVLSKLIGQRWRSISDADVKQYYFDLAKADMERYKRQMKSYDTSRT